MRYHTSSFLKRLLIKNASSRSSRTHSGFTLFEILMVSSISVLILGLITGTMVIGQSTFTRTVAMVDTQQKARFAMENLTNELEQSQSAQVTIESCGSSNQCVGDIITFRTPQVTGEAEAGTIYYNDGTVKWGADGTLESTIMYLVPGPGFSDQQGRLVRIMEEYIPPPPPPVCDKDGMCDFEEGETLNNCCHDCASLPPLGCGDGKCCPDLGETERNCTDCYDPGGGHDPGSKLLHWPLFTTGNLAREYKSEFKRFLKRWCIGVAYAELGDEEDYTLRVIADHIREINFTGFNRDGNPVSENPDLVTIRIEAAANFLLEEEYSFALRSNVFLKN
ncbi:PilW family protein [Candidatus Omnitrophota bacterium]